MCDYSLLSFPSRLAIEGEQLISYRFRSHSLGLASPADLKAATRSQREGDFRSSWWAQLKNWLLSPEPCTKEVPAVCVPPGARLRVMGIREKIQRKFGVGPVEDVMFFERSASAYEYRDAILFTNGRRALLQDLHEGLCFEVLSLGMTESELEPDALRMGDPRQIRAESECSAVPVSRDKFLRGWQRPPDESKSIEVVGNA